MAHVLITGASSGIGEALALELGRRGHALTLLARRREALEAVAARIGEQAFVAVADVMDPASLVEAVQQAEAAHGPVDICVANAGGGGETPGWELDVERATRMVRLNIEGVFATFGAVLPGMLERGRGHLVGMGSLAGHVGMPRAAAYSASKAGVQALCQSLRIDLAPRGITVSTINPGFVRTPGQELDTPLMLDVEDAARRIADGIERRSAIIEFPWQLSWPLRLARWLLPRAVLEALLRALPA